MWCDVVICGSLFSSNDDIKKIKNYLLNKNNNPNIYYNPITPFKRNVDVFDIPFNEIVRERYNAIDRSYVVIGVTKPDGSFGEGTTYELEYARKINKNILIYDTKSKYFYPYDNTVNTVYVDIFSMLKKIEYSGELVDLKDLNGSDNSGDLQDSEDRKDGDLDAYWYGYE